MGTKDLNSTAYLIAWGRSSDTKLSNDPYSKYWLTENGVHFARKFAGKVTSFAGFFFCLRGRYIIDILKSFDKRFPDGALVNVGSGLTPYPFILSDKLDYYCLDQKHVLEFYKTKADEGMKSGQLPIRKINYVPIDLNLKESITKLRAILRNNKKPIIVLFEGILTYLSRARGFELLKVCSEELTAGSQVMVHVFPEAFKGTKIMKKLEEYISEGLGLPMPALTCFHSAEIENLQGFELIEHVNFLDLKKRYAPNRSFPKEELIDEHFFLLRKL